MPSGAGRLGSKRKSEEPPPPPPPPPPPKPKTPAEQALDYIRSLAPGERRVAVVGSRDWADLGAVRDFVNSLPDDATVVSGGARGVDSAAEGAADARGLKKSIHPAEWNKYGKSAGYRRNPSIVRDAEVVVAFRDPASRGGSKGTQNAIDLANAAGKPVYLIPPSTNP